MAIRRFSSRTQQLDSSFLLEHLKGARSYKRIAGYFTSSLFEVAGEQLQDIPQVQIVCNVDIHPNDLKVAQVRAARMVVDTGIHDRRWGRERAIDYLTHTTGLPRDAMEREVARYSVWPGQAASYYYGRQRLLEIRERAEAVLGGRFDATAFNSTVLTGGPRPFSQVEADVEDWYGELLDR